MTSRPRATCPVCGRRISGRAGAAGKLVLRSHMLALVGTKESNWGPAIPCKGSGMSVELTKADSG
jgi:hypothetical protein